MTQRPQIVATIGPSSGDKHIIKEMIARGMGVARLNFSWGTHDSHAKNIKIVREAARELGRTVPIIQDLSGPRLQKTSGHVFDAAIHEAFTKKDLVDLQFGLAQKVDYIAMSFVGSAADILKLKAEIAKAGASTPVIAKIERKIAVEHDHLDAIIDAADAIMIARGDLGNEIPLEKIPFIERTIIEKCKKVAKPVITATQMMLSMVSNEIPTRAEVTDVAFAIISGSDAVMLSEESADGRYPVKAVEMMEKIIIEAEKHMQGKLSFNAL
jgi:pyruvate kinase